MTLIDVYLVIRIPIVLILDALLGESAILIHPVVIAGRLISGCEYVFRRVFPHNKWGERCAGVLTVVVVCSIFFGIPAFALYGLLRAARHLYLPFLTYAVCALDLFWGYQSIAARGLCTESLAVFRALRSSLTEAQQAVGRIVGRDTGNLDAPGVIRAAVETVAENTTDGVTAPLIAFAIGGSPLALLYKSINTMDSMIGYRNEQYQYFGTAAARLDDIVNFIPARFSAVCMIAASALCLPFVSVPVRMMPFRAAKIFIRDRKNHASPNSAQTESVCAGALGIQLGGDTVYNGITEHHPLIGDVLREPDSADIERAVILMYGTAVLSCIVCTAARLAYSLLR
jgi:adenosylcobinamide-phosphate synthase